jgi:hypothetical protein
MQTSEARREIATPTVQRAPRWARVFVWSFLATFVVCGVVGIEAWPFTGFRLFSHLRYEHQTEWQAFAVSPEGRESRLRLSRFPGGYNGFPLIMKSFTSRGPRDRADMCQAWAVAAYGLRGRTLAIRIYAIDRHLEPRQGHAPAAPPIRALAYTCPGAIVRNGVSDAAG